MSDSTQQGKGRTGQNIASGAPFHFTSMAGAEYRADYVGLCRDMNEMYLDRDEITLTRVLRNNALEDLFVFGYFVMNVPLNHPWLVKRVYECQDQTHLDVLNLWAREHFKTTIWSHLLTEWELMNNPELTFGIFSWKKPIAGKIYQKIKTDFEKNELLRALFPDRIWAKPDVEAPRWSNTEGLFLKRNSGVMEPTISPHGLIDGMPTSAHFDRRVYDDVETDVTTATPDMIKKLIRAYENSEALGNGELSVKRYQGTIFHFSGLSNSLKKRSDLYQINVYPAERDASMKLDGILMSRKLLDSKRASMGGYVYSCQMLLNPVDKAEQKFKTEWLQFYTRLTETTNMNVYILCDYATTKKKSSDYTAFRVWGFAADQKKYLLQSVWDKLSQRERWETLKNLVQKWNPLKVGIEDYGFTSEIEYIRERQETENFRFTVVPVANKTLRKEDRIQRDVPYYETGRIIFPVAEYYTTRTGKVVDVTREFIDKEFSQFPFAEHDDLMDCDAYWHELECAFPFYSRPTIAVNKPFSPLSSPKKSSGWMVR